VTRKGIPEGLSMGRKGIYDLRILISRRKIPEGLSIGRKEDDRPPRNFSTTNEIPTGVMHRLIICISALMPVYTAFDVISMLIKK
jgi:hypothetical protein